MAKKKLGKQTVKLLKALELAGDPFEVGTPMMVEPDHADDMVRSGEAEAVEGNPPNLLEHRRSEGKNYFNGQTFEENRERQEASARAAGHASVADRMANFDRQFAVHQARVASTTPPDGCDQELWDSLTPEQRGRAVFHFDTLKQNPPIEKRRRGSGGDRDDITVKIERHLGKLAQHVATDRGVSIAEYLSDVVRDTVTRDANEVARKMLEGGK